MGPSEILKHIEERDKERKELLAQLAMWAKVNEQGIDPEQVECFGFDPAALTQKQLFEWRLQQRHQHVFDIPPYSPPYTKPVDAKTTKTRTNTVYNYVKLKTGERRLLDPLVEVPEKVA